jgi:hypothetical protein
MLIKECNRILFCPFSSAPPSLFFFLNYVPDPCLLRFIATAQTVLCVVIDELVITLVSDSGCPSDMRYSLGIELYNP